MDSIAVIKPEMGVLSQERLSLSPFGALSQAFAEELLARAERVEGQWSQVPLDLLQEGENQPASPPVRPVIQVDLKLVLEALRKEKNRSEQQRATERIVERILQRRETLRETVIKPAPSEQSEVEKPQAPQHTTQIQQNIYQILNQILRVQRPDGTWGEQLLRQPSETMPAKTGRPGQLGRQAAVFSQTLRVLREEGKAFPVPQTADRQTAGWSAVPGNVPAERSTTPLDLTHREEEAGTETATKSGQQAAVQLLRTAERLERVLRTEAAQTEETIKKETKTMPIVQKMGPNQEHDLPERSAHREQSTGSLHTSEPVSGKKQAQASDAIHTAARQLEQLTRQGAEGDKKQQISAPHPLQTGQRTEQSQPVTARDIRTVTVEKAGKLDGKPAPAATTAHLPSVELTHRTEEEKEVQTPPVQPMEKRRKAEQSQPVTARDIRTVAAEKAGQPDREPAQTATTAPLPGVELTHRTEEEKEDQMSPVQPVEKGRNAEHSQPVTARDIRMVTAETASQAVSEPVPATTAHLPGVELTHRTEEEKEAPIPPVQPMEKGRKAEHSQPVTARDIRTVSAEKTSPMASGPAPAATTAPLPGVELTHRMEEEKEVQTPPVQPVKKGQAAEYSQPVTARDIRTVSAETANPTDSEPAPASTAAPLPGVELTHRTEEKETQPPTVQQAQKSISRTEQNHPAALRDIRTGKRLSHVQRTTSSNLQSPVFAGGADTAPTSVVSRMAQQSQPSGPIQGGLSPTAMPMGPELTLRTGEAPAGQQFSAGMEHPQLPGERVQRESPLTVAAEDIRVGRRFTKVYTPLGAEAEEEPGPAGVLPPLTLEERQTSPGQPVGETPRNIQRRSAARRAETASQPVELTYGPSQQPAEQAPAQTSKKADGQGESDYVRNLPDWARRFLKESWSGHAGTQEMSVARNISTQQGGEETVQWTAPNYRPAPPMDHREKRQEEPKRPQQVHISEAEIQRTADRVYRILEDRIREERIRLGF